MRMVNVVDMHASLLLIACAQTHKLFCPTELCTCTLQVGERAVDSPCQVKQEKLSAALEIVLNMYA